MRIQLIIICALLFASSTARAGDWPQWRGPNRDGHAAADEVIPNPLPKGLKVKWRTEVGEGYSSPVIVKGVVYLMSRGTGPEASSEIVQGVDSRTGKPIWRYAYPLPFTAHPAAVTAGPGPKATVAVDEGRVYAFGITEVFTCLDAATGKVLWQHKLNERFKPHWPETGASGSPLIDGPRVIVQMGQENKGGLAAFDKATGEQLWWDESDGPSYASPVIFELAGKRQAVSFTQGTFSGVESKTGARLWEVPFKTGYNQNICTPVLIGDGIVFAGLDQGIRMIRLDAKKGGGFDVSEIWNTNKVSVYMDSPLLAAGRILIRYEEGKGTLVCLDPSCGCEKWRSPGRIGDYVSMTVAKDSTGAEKVLMLTPEGRMKVIDPAAAEYKELADWTVSEDACWAHPALAEGSLFVKDAKNLIRLEWE